MLRFKCFRLLTLVPFLFSLPVLVHAQVNTSAIAGMVTDASGSVVPNANITVTQAATNLVRKVTTSDSGEYVVAQLGPGVYGSPGKGRGMGFDSTRRWLRGVRAA